MDLSHASYQPLLPYQNVSTTGEILASPAGAHPEKIGLIDGARKWTFADLDQLANQYAHALLDNFGDGIGPVGIIGKNSAEYLIAHFGTSRGSLDSERRPGSDGTVHRLADRPVAEAVTPRGPVNGSQTTSRGDRPRRQRRG